MSEVNRIDQHIARLQDRLANGSVSVEGIAAVKELVAILTVISSKLVAYREADHPVSRSLPQSLPGSRQERTGKLKLRPS